MQSCGRGLLYAILFHILIRDSSPQPQKELIYLSPVPYSLNFSIFLNRFPKR